MITTNDRSTATAIHLSTLSQYFIPFGNFIFPVIIWSALKSRSNYIDAQGRQAINFQLSIFLYSIVLAVIAIPILIINVLKGIQFSEMRHNDNFIHENFDPQNMSTIVVVAVIAVILFCLLKVLEFLLVIIAAVKTSNGEDYQYPVTINFIPKIHQPEVVPAEPQSGDQTPANAQD